MSFPITPRSSTVMMMDEDDYNEHMMLASLEHKPITFEDSVATLLEEDCLVEDFEFFNFEPEPVSSMPVEAPQPVVSMECDTSAPTKHDVLCGQSRVCADHAGNRRFQVVLDIYAKQYDAATTKQDKMSLTKEIVATIKETSGRFLKFKDGEWVEITDVAARDKVSHALRTKVASWKRQEQRKAAAVAAAAATQPTPVSSKPKPTHRRKKSPNKHQRSSSDILATSFDSHNSDEMMVDIFRGQQDIFDGLTKDGKVSHPLKK